MQSRLVRKLEKHIETLIGLATVMESHIGSHFMQHYMDETIPLAQLNSLRKSCDDMMDYLNDESFATFVNRVDDYLDETGDKYRVACFYAAIVHAQQLLFDHLDQTTQYRRLTNARDKIAFSKEYRGIVTHSRNILFDLLSNYDTDDSFILNAAYPSRIPHEDIVALQKGEEKEKKGAEKKAFQEKSEHARVRITAVRISKARLQNPAMLFLESTSQSALATLHAKSSAAMNGIKKTENVSSPVQSPLVAAFQILSRADSDKKEQLQALKKILIDEKNADLLEKHFSKNDVTDEKADNKKVGHTLLTYAIDLGLDRTLRNARFILNECLPTSEAHRTKALDAVVEEKSPHPYRGCNALAVAVLKKKSPLVQRLLALRKNIIRPERLDDEFKAAYGSIMDFIKADNRVLLFSSVASKKRTREPLHPAAAPISTDAKHADKKLKR